MLKNTLKQIGDVDTDEAKQQVKYLTVELVKAETAAKQAEKQLANINQLKFDRITNIIGNLGDNLVKGGAVMTAGVTLPLALIGKQALETASDLVEVQNVVDVSFKDSAQYVNEWSKSLLDSNGISELTAKQNAGLYKSMANGMGVADEAGTEMSKTLTELIGDVASYKNLSFGEVGNKFKSIFTGETESLKEIAVIMTEANLNAFALSHGMEQLSDDMSQADKVALRYAFVVDALKEAHGDFARTIDSTANQTKLAQERFKQLSAELAQELLPIATDLLKCANNCMKSFDKLSDSQKRNIVIVLGLAAGLGPVVTTLGGIVKGCELSAKAWGKINTALKAHDAANKTAIASTGALNATMALNPYVLVAAGIAVATAATIANSIANDEVLQKQKELNQALKDTKNTYEQTLSTTDSQLQSHHAELDVADKLINRYEELNGKVGITAAEKAELSNIVKQLSDLLSVEIGIVNNSTGAFNASAASLRNLTQARREEISQIAMKEKAVASQKALIDSEEKLLEAEANLNKAKKDQINLDKKNPWLTFIWDEAPVKRNLSDAEETYKKYVDEVKKYSGEVQKYTAYVPQLEVKSESKDNKKSIQDIEKQFKEEKELLDYRMSIGQENEQSYYQKLQGIKTKFFTNSKKDYADMTDEEKRLNVEIHNQEVALNQKRLANAKSYTTEKSKVAKEMYDKQKQLAKDAYDENKKLLKDSFDDNKKMLEENYKQEIKLIDEAYNAKEKAINAQIKAIDKQIEARKRLKQEQETDSEINTLKAQLSYGKMDEFTRREMEAELKRLEDAKAEAKWEQDQNNLKEALNIELSNAKEVAEQKKSDLQELLELERTELENQYNLQMEKLDVTYELHTAQLEAMFENSSTQMGKISNDFVNTITKGCESAAATLSSLISKANSAASTISNLRASNSYDNSQKSSVFHINGTNYTDSQVQHILDKYIYE